MRPDNIFVVAVVLAAGSKLKQGRGERERRESRVVGITVTSSMSFLVMRENVTRREEKAQSLYVCVRACFV